MFQSIVYWQNIEAQKFLEFEPFQEILTEKQEFTVLVENWNSSKNKSVLLINNFIFIFLETV